MIPINNITIIEDSQTPIEIYSLVLDITKANIYFLASQESYRNCLTYLHKKGITPKNIFLKENKFFTAQEITEITTHSDIILVDGLEGICVTLLEQFPKNKTILVSGDEDYLNVAEYKGYASIDKNKIERLSACIKELLEKK